MATRDTRVAVVTGAGSTPHSDPNFVGVGAAISRILCRGGMRVLVVDKDRTAAEYTVAALMGEGGVAMSCEGDVAVEADCAFAASEAISAWGRIDVVVNNAGILGASGASDLDVDLWNQVFAVNVTGAMTMAKHAIPHLPRGGSIVNISSIAAFRPGVRGISYPSSKGAMIALTKALAVKLASHGVRVNAVCPGSPWTPMAIRSLGDVDEATVARVRESRERQNLLGIEGTAWDVADAVAFFAGDGARWITGQVLVVDGGATLEPTRAMSVPRATQKET